MKVLLASCAEHVIIDAETGRLSLINIFEGITATFPVLIQNFTFVIATEREEMEGAQHALEARFHLDGHELKSGTILVDYEEGQINRSLIGLRGLIIPQPGRLFARVYKDGELISETSFSIDQDEVQMNINEQAEL